MNSTKRSYRILSHSLVVGGVALFLSSTALAQQAPTYYSPEAVPVYPVAQQQLQQPQQMAPYGAYAPYNAMPAPGMYMPQQQMMAPVPNNAVPAPTQLQPYLAAPNVQNRIQNIEQQLDASGTPPMIYDAAEQNAQAVSLLPQNSAQIGGDDIPVPPAPVAAATAPAQAMPAPAYQPIYEQPTPPQYQQSQFQQPAYQPQQMRAPAVEINTAPAQAAPQATNAMPPLPDIDYNRYSSIMPSYHFETSRAVTGTSVAPSASAPNDTVFTPSARTTKAMSDQPYPNIAPQPGFMFEIEEIDDLGQETLITRKIGEMRTDLSQLQEAISIAKDQLETVRFSAEVQSADYYAVVAAIQSRLQAGSTPGNPRLVNSWNIAQDRLDRLAEDVDALGKLAQRVSAQADMSEFLLEAARATFGLSGALEQDHADLEILEDDVTNTVVVINRLLNEITDDINRRTAYLASERKNLQTLASGITNGELFGRSLTNQYYRRVTDPLSGAGVDRLRAEGKRPLAVIRFNQQNVDYQQPVYSALNDAIRINPDAQFEVIAVAPDEGTSAELALATTQAKQKAEDVVRTLSNMGLPNGKMLVSASRSTEADSTEIHIYVR